MVTTRPIRCLATAAFVALSHAGPAAMPLSKTECPLSVCITVVKVIDGDTLVGETPSGLRVKVRLLDIDAPEKSQAFGQAARKYLSTLCLGKSALLENLDTDQYDRNLATVTCAGVNANARMIDVGMAWVYERYSDDAELKHAQNFARATCKGLWQEKVATAPWNYRKAQRAKDLAPLGDYTRQMCRT